MNFDDCIKKIIDEIEYSESDVNYYLIKGIIILYVNGRCKVWNKIHLKGSVRKRSDYKFDVFLTIEHVDDYTFEMRVGKIIKKNYFNINSESDKIPIKNKPGKHACISGEIYHIEKR